MKPTQHTSFQIDGVNYLLEGNTSQAIWPRLIDRVHKHLERIGKESASHMYGNTAVAKGYTKVAGVLTPFHLTINPKGLNIGIERPVSCS